MFLAVGHLSLVATRLTTDREHQSRTNCKNSKPEFGCSEVEPNSTHEICEKVLTDRGEQEQDGYKFEFQSNRGHRFFHRFSHDLSKVRFLFQAACVWFQCSLSSCCLCHHRVFFSTNSCSTLRTLHSRSKIKLSIQKPTEFHRQNSEDMSAYGCNAAALLYVK